MSVCITERPSAVQKAVQLNKRVCGTTAGGTVLVLMPSSSNRRL